MSRPDLVAGRVAQRTRPNQLRCVFPTCYAPKKKESFTTKDTKVTKEEKIEQDRQAFLSFVFLMLFFVSFASFVSFVVETLI